MKKSFLKTSISDGPLLLICLAALNINCDSKSGVLAVKADPALVFQSGFENTTIVQKGDFAEISGADPSFTEKMTG